MQPTKQCGCSRYLVRRAALAALLASVSTIAGCSSGRDETVFTGTPPADSPDDTPDEPSDGEPTPQYVISTRLFSADLSTEVGYLTTVDSVAPGTTYTLDDAVEIQESGIAFSRPGDTGVFWASLSAPTITRWEVSREGVFTRGATVSFANLGLANAGAAADSPIFSADRSYFVDQSQGTIVIWNPDDMELVGTIPLDMPSDDALAPNLFSTLGVRDNQLFATMFSWSREDWTVLGQESRLFVIDATTETVVRSSDESRCNQVVLGGVASDGTAYFSARSYFTLPRLVFGDGYGAGSCALRVVPRGDDFDQGFDVDLSALVGGRPAGDFTLVNDDTAYIRVWHTESVSEPTEANWDTMRNEAGFRWWRWEIGAEAAEEIADQDSAANTVQLRNIDGKTYALRYTPDYSETTLEELRPNGTIVPSLRGPGGIYGVLRMR